MAIFTDPTFLLVLSGVSVFGFIAAVLGTFAMLNKQSLLADTISHAALPGIAGAFLCTYSNNPFILLFGGAIAGMIGALLVLFICHTTPLKKDAALGFVLSAFFGLGLVLLTIIQKRAVAQQAILNKFLFGCAATLLPYEVRAMTMTAIAVLLVVMVFWKQFIIVSFDMQYAYAIGMRVGAWHALLTMLLVLVIVLGLQTVGVVLMSTLCVAPAVTMRQWFGRVNQVAISAGFCGSFASCTGASLSSSMKVPTGPAIVVVATTLMIVSIVCAPERGIIGRVIKRLLSTWK